MTVTKAQTFSVEEVMNHIRSLLLSVVEPKTQADIEFLISLNNLIEEQKQKQQEKE